MPARRLLDAASTATIVATFVLFGVAVSAKGFTHDLLLEAGVLLVSVKLIFMSYKNNVASAELNGRLARIEAALDDRPPVPADKIV